MRVLKFGGSSVASAERIEAVVNLLTTYYEKDIQFAVVFSAFGGATDQLLDMCDKAAAGHPDYESVFVSFRQRHLDTASCLLEGPQLERTIAELEVNMENLQDLLHGIFLLREASPRSRDHVLSFGERSSAWVISQALNGNGVHARFLDARQFMVTDDQFGNATVNFDETYPKIPPLFKQTTDIQIVTGFLGATPEGVTTTLGRGGSDYTAAILAAGLQAEAIEIWTDVNGVLTADPRKVRKAFTIPKLTYAEAMELSHFGAKVIYPPTIQPALSYEIPILIKNTFNPDFEGSFISVDGSNDPKAVRGISSISNIALLTLQGSGLFGVPGIAARLFGSLAAEKINIILITQGSSEHSISFSVKPEDASKAKKAVENAFAQEITHKTVDPVKIEDDLSVVAVIGENMRYQPGIAGRLFEALGKNGVNVIAIAQGSSELNISVVVKQSDEQKALNTLHEAFFLSDTKELHLFMVGAGLIGGTLIGQIKEHAPFLKEQHQLEVKVTGLANSKRMYFAEDGIDLHQWKQVLDKAAKEMDIAGYIQEMKTMNLSNSIFIDNTASEEVSRHYESILDSSISISTPNKISTSSSFSWYKRLKSFAAKRGVQFQYETNVGAGLPVISTLRNLILSGDEVYKIEGVLSGSLSYIFNHFDGSRPFSAIVQEARSLGLTEPDPREDLGGLDVRRKIIILAREAGFAVNVEDVEMRSFLPEACLQASNVDAFFEALERSDHEFEQMRKEAAAKGKVWRMAATLDHGRASVGLVQAGKDHPFYNLSGSDNMVIFNTQRYAHRPLVVQGPGAGAEVTAAGVFAEVIAIGNFLKS